MKTGTEEPTGVRGLLDGSGSHTLGTGSIGGKACGLAGIESVLRDSDLQREFPSISVEVPVFTVIATDFFDEFMKYNDLYDAQEMEEADDYIASAFMKADLSPKLVGHLWHLISGIHQPLAIRSSSMLEDSLEEPFAGIYHTKMIPNYRASDESRFRKLVDAIKLVYASTFFGAARDYSRALDLDQRDEKMAVIIQKVMGRRFGRRFYPTVSGVARSFNYYPFGGASRQDGVIDLALGLGKTIVDGGESWSYCPAYPTRPRPFGSTGEMLENTREFWAVNMSRPERFDPLQETEFMISLPLADAEYDDVLGLVASTYDSESDRIFHGTARNGPRIIDFAPILKDGLLPLNDLVTRLLSICREHAGSEVEIEFALDTGTVESPARLGFLQVRPMAASSEEVDISEGDLSGSSALVTSSGALGNGVRTDITHVVYVKPESFDKSRTRSVAEEISRIDQRLTQDGLSYVLIGFGRWGSSDSWLGIPVTWGQISGAAAIVEVTGEKLMVELSQGSHFFHNIIAFGVSYLSVSELRGDRVDWSILQSAGETVIETEFIRCVRLDSTMTVKVDGRSGRGVILCEQCD